MKYCGYAICYLIASEVNNISQFPESSHSYYLQYRTSAGIHCDILNEHFWRVNGESLYLFSVLLSPFIRLTIESYFVFLYPLNMFYALHLLTVSLFFLYLLLLQNPYYAYQMIAMPGYPAYDDRIYRRLQSLNLTLPFQYEGRL